MIFFDIWRWLIKRKLKKLLADHKKKKKCYFYSVKPPEDLGQ